MNFCVITGISGAGKSTAVAALEDIGFYCVDNLPPRLIPKIYELCAQIGSGIENVAVVTDSRGGKMLGELQNVLEQMDSSGSEYHLLFIDADDGVLMRRYKETRRRHPLSENTSQTISEMIAKERQLLEGFKEKADYLINTTYLTRSQMKMKISDIFLGEGKSSMLVQCFSFGFKYGIPVEADIVLDVRCLPNPFYVEELRHQTGLDEPVKTFVLESESSAIFMERFFGLVDFLLPLYKDEGKSQLIIAFGCTGGKHRSVVVSQALYAHLQAFGINSSVSHRDVEK